MNLQTLPNSARIWVYLSNRAFTDHEIEWLTARLTEITSNWKAHGTPLKAGFAIDFKQLIVMAVDESHEPASGCSIDSVVHEIQAIEKHLGVDLFGRTDVPILKDHQIELLGRQALKDRILNGTLSEESPMLDLTITNLGTWRQSHIKTLNQSWAVRWLPKLQS